MSLKLSFFNHQSAIPEKAHLLLSKMISVTCVLLSK